MLILHRKYQQKLQHADTPIAFFLLKTENKEIREDLWRVAQIETSLETSFLCFILNGVHGWVIPSLTCTLEYISIKTHHTISIHRAPPLRSGRLTCPWVIPGEQAVHKYQLPVFTVSVNMKSFRPRYHVHSVTCQYPAALVPTPVYFVFDIIPFSLKQHAVFRQ